MFNHNLVTTIGKKLDITNLSNLLLINKLNYKLLLYHYQETKSAIIIQKEWKKYITKKNIKKLDFWFAKDPGLAIPSISLPMDTGPHIYSFALTPLDLNPCGHINFSNIRLQ